MSKQPLEAEEMLAVRQAAGSRRRAPSFQENPVGAIFNVFPLILIPVLIYNIWAFGSTAVNKAAALVRQHLDNPIMCVPMASATAIT